MNSHNARLKEAEILLQRMKDAGFIDNQKNKKTKVTPPPKTPKIQITIEDGEITITRTQSSQTQKAKRRIATPADQYAYLGPYDLLFSPDYAYGGSYNFDSYDTYMYSYFDLNGYNYQTDAFSDSDIYFYGSDLYDFGYDIYDTYQDDYEGYDLSDTPSKNDHVIQSNQDITIRVLTSGEIVITTHPDKRIPQKRNRR